MPAFFIRLAMVLLTATCASAIAQEPPPIVHFDIDVKQDAKPISRFIYGANHTLEGAWSSLPFTRVGGNRWTVYNWVTNASNAGNDWHFQNDDLLGGGNVPGGALIPALDNAAKHNAGIVITVPINGYVSADMKKDGDVRKSGADYLSTRFLPERPRKGRDAHFTLTPDPRTPVVSQDEFINWVMAKYPLAGAVDTKVPIFFALDNEPDLWSSTHAEVHPKPATYAEMVQKTIDYASAIKDVAPQTLIFGPVNYGWQGFVRLQNAPDANNRDFQEFYLAQLAAAEQQTGRRLLDVLDVHWYPEAKGGNTRIIGQETTPEVVAARVQAPRSLWDPQYQETSWITNDALHAPINLLPTLQAKIDRNYPGTKLAMTEYNYGGGAHISGAIAEADVLGIFGREGIFAAAEWPMGKDESYIAAAFQIYRNFDGKNSTFGDTSVLADNNSVTDSSIYASIDFANPGRMVLVAINKSDHPIEAEIRVANGQAFTQAQAFQLTGDASHPKPVPAPSITDPANFSYVMPAFSVTTIQLLAPKPVTP